MSDNIVLIGMPGAGKSTIGVLLARQLGYSFIDTDLVIQDQFEQRLQDVVDQLGQDKFRQLEAETCINLRCHHAIVATGGSVVYSAQAMAALRKLGSVIWLNLPFPEIESRVNAFPDRGLAIQPGQTLEDLYNERMPLYQQFAHVEVDATGLDPANLVKAIILKSAVGKAW